MAYGLLALLLAPGLLRLQLDNDPEAFFPADAVEVEQYRSLERDFGPDRGVRLVLRGPGLWTRPGLAWLGELESAAASLRGVAGAAGSVTFHRWHLQNWPPRDVGAFRDHLLASPLDRQAGWISSDATLLTVLVGLHRQRPESRRRVLADLERLLAAAPSGIETSMAGVTVIEAAVDRSVIQLLHRVLPLVTAVMVTILLLVFGLRADTAAPLLLVGLSELFLFGAMGYAGIRLHFVLTVLAPIVLVVGLATAVHVLLTVHDRRREGLDPLTAVEATYRVKAWPVLWTGVTTGIGFGSFAASSSLAVQELGLWSAIGFTFLTLSSLSFYPALLVSLSGGSPRAATKKMAGAVRTLAERLLATALARPRRCHLLFALPVAAAALGLPRLAIDTDVLDYLRPSSSARTEVERLEENGVGVFAADVVLTSEAERGASGPLRGLEPLTDLASLTQELRRLPEVLSGVSAADLVDTVAGTCLPTVDASRRSAREARTLALERIEATPELDRMLSLMVTPSGRRARISLLVHAAGIEELGPTIQTAGQLAHRHVPGARVAVTGQYPLILAAQGSILRSMALAIALTALSITVIFRLAVGSWSVAIRALVPNVWVVILVLGLLGWTGTSLDSITIMVASAILGLVVDDTLHYLGFLRRRLHGSDGTMEETRAASRQALVQAAPGHVLTSLILALGFACVALSTLVPVARFAISLALAIVAALVADLIWVPTLMASVGEPAARRLQEGAQPPAMT